MPFLKSLSLAFAGLVSLLVLTGTGLKADSISLCDSVQGNLVQNCGFETGDFTNWNPAFATVGSTLHVYAGIENSGSFGLLIGGAVANFPDTIQQTIPTTAGQYYNVSFYLNTLQGAGTPADFQASWGGMSIYDQPNSISSGGYQQVNLSMDIVATASDTVLSFSAFNVPRSFYLDDIIVTLGAIPLTVPEPGTVMFSALGILGLLAAKYRRARSCQVTAA